MLRIEVLAPQHDRSGFDCGTPALNRYLQHLARQHLDKGISRTFVLIDDAVPTEILGFFTLGVCEVDARKLPRKWAKKYPARIPAAKLARLAVAKKLRRQGYGGALIIEALRRVLLGAEHFGLVAVFVDAKGEAARGFYERFGFLSLPENGLEMFLPLATMKALATPR